MIIKYLYILFSFYLLLDTLLPCSLLLEFFYIEVLNLFSFFFFRRIFRLFLFIFLFKSKRKVLSFSSKTYEFLFKSRTEKRKKKIFIFLRKEIVVLYLMECDDEKEIKWD